MKKVLLASAVLAMTATVAAAEVTVGGDGRMGVTYTEGAVNELAFTSRIRISFTASGETDGGLSFGGSVRADNYENDQATNGLEGSVFLSGEQVLRISSTKRASGGGLSITSCWPMTVPRWLVTIRVSVSTELPAPLGTSTRMGRLG